MRFAGIGPNLHRAQILRMCSILQPAETVNAKTSCAAATTSGLGVTVLGAPKKKIT